MALPDPLRLIGATGSPYTRKMVALLRYRRIPYSVTWGDPGTVLDARGIAKPKLLLHPTFLFLGDNGTVEAVCDSTPIIRRLEREKSDRSVLPSDPALGFINYLIEDFADEWCTKYMFHYRWYPAEDAANASTLLPVSMDVTLPSETLDRFRQVFSDRQIGRLHVVGSNEATAPIIDASYRRLLTALEAHFQELPFLLGRRPGSGDFALYGQLTQLVGFDPTPRKISRDISPRTVGWVGVMEDQCGLEPRAKDWSTLEDLPATIGGIISEIGRVYAPAMVANARAIAAGETVWETEIDGALWAQKTFPYQGKCLSWLRESYARLSDSDTERVNALLDGSGCEALFAEL